EHRCPRPECQTGAGRSARREAARGKGGPCRPARHEGASGLCQRARRPRLGPPRARIGHHSVRGGWMPIEEACRVYNISVDEFLAWERDIDRNGVPGLRSTRYQIYRDTDIRRGSCHPNQEPKSYAATSSETAITPGRNSSIVRPANFIPT